MTVDQTDALRRYAAGELPWKWLRDDGWRYSDVLTGLGELGLRPPIAGDKGPNAEALARGRATVRMLLTRDQAKP